MSTKYKHGDEVEAVSRLENPRVNKGDRFKVVGHYEIDGHPGLVVYGVGGAQIAAESHFKPVPPEPPVPGELWVFFREGQYPDAYHSKAETAGCIPPGAVGGKAWRYVLVEGQE